MNCTLLIKQAQREFARLSPTSTCWHHPRYGYVTRTDGKTFWAFASTRAPLPSSVLRTPGGKRRLFRSVDGAIAALVMLKAEQWRAMAKREQEQTRANAKLPSFYGGDSGRDPDADRDARLDDAKHFGD